LGFQSNSMVPVTTNQKFSYVYKPWNNPHEY
jgi:hypothetical protein